MTQDTLENVATLFPDELEDFIREHREGSYTLLDVRQPVEYEEGHLPGALLIPLPLLSGSLDRLPADRTIIVYCAVGGRSRMAAQFLSHRGFRNVYQLEGGINAWEQPAASGPREFHLKFVSGDESPKDIIYVAYQMEEGLKRFHQRASEKTNDAALSDLLGHLVRAEEKHESTLLDLLSSVYGEDSGLSPASVTSSGGLMEGGIDIDEFMIQNEAFLKTVSGYLEIAMMIEIQALDLYLRMAAESRNDTTRNVLFRIADEEKQHLSLLGRFLEEMPKS